MRGIASKLITFTLVALLALVGVGGAQPFVGSLASEVPPADQAFRVDPIACADDLVVRMVFDTGPDPNDETLVFVRNSDARILLVIKYTAKNPNGTFLIDRDGSVASLPTVGDLQALYPTPCDLLDKKA